jgi:hypothetical protein
MNLEKQNQQWNIDNIHRSLCTANTVVESTTAIDGQLRNFNMEGY